MGRHPNNKVWEYFDYISDAVAECQQCKATILTSNNKRQNMVRHLFDVHGINTYTSGPKVGLIGKPTTNTNKKQKERKIKKYIKETTQSYILRDGNDKTERYDETLNKDPHDTSDDDSMLEKSTNRLTKDEHIKDPLLNILKIEEPVLKVKIFKKGTQYSKNEFKSINNGSDLNQEYCANGSISSTCNKLSPLEHSRLHSVNSVSKEFSLNSQNEAEILKVTAIAEKLKAEARYFNELADLNRSKRIYVDLQCQLLRNQIASTTNIPKHINSETNISPESFFPMDQISPTSEQRFRSGA